MNLIASVHKDVGRQPENLMPSSSACLSFAVLSAISLFGPLVNSVGTYPLSDLWVALPYFCAVLAVQVCIVNGVIRSFLGRLLIFAAVLALNIFYFSHVLTSGSKLHFFITSALYVFVYFLASYRSHGKLVLLAFVAINMVMSGATVYSDNGRQNALKRGRVEASVGMAAKRSVYVIGIDSMVSRPALNRLYGQKSSPAYDFLLKSGFDLYDRKSPGDQTITTFGALLHYSSDVHPRTVRAAFSGQAASPLYNDLASLKFKRQFFFENDYFGKSTGNIESFYPEADSLNFCQYVDDRWGFYFCRLYKSYVDHDSSETALNGVDVHFERFARHAQFDGPSKWFSIHHIWYPGHTVGNYDGTRLSDRDNFKKYYIDSHGKLKYLFEKVVAYIRSKDPEAVIVFFGDHGSYLLSKVPVGADLSDFGHVTSEILLADARDVLVAVYPSGFCQREIAGMRQLENLMIEIALCAAG